MKQRKPSIMKHNQTHPIEKALRIVIIGTFVITTILSLVSRGNHSPMDSYCTGVVNNIQDSTRHAQEVEAFLKK